MAKVEVIARSDIADLLRPRRSGEVVDPHVTRAKHEPRPDFAEMQRMIFGGTSISPEGSTTVDEAPHG